MVISRFAPSPTGRLHLGHAFSAVRAHDLARAEGGHFLLRIEDIDPGRSREAHVAGIEEDLRWLGLDWDGPVVRQSQRLDLYAEALERLKARGLVYPCFCTRAEIAESAAAPHGATPVYPGSCRGLPLDAERLARQPHCWRLDMGRAMASLPSVTPDWIRGPAASPASEEKEEAGSRLKAGMTGEVGLWWQDEFVGRVRAVPELQGDVVLARKDAPTSYHLAVTVDDAAQGVTDVVRGADLFEATHVHRLLQALLELPTPFYHHHALLTGPDGRRLAKRDGAKSLTELRAEGADPQALLVMLRRKDDEAPAKA
ncbi:tRNA glutamyl-Q(34) synthetase GluQRS [Sphingomonas sp. AP4-R1]|uniref:tRNA glutamyl-Q(34) synthetase GluQRS n=1 Tax=Sphingomonas sp. AP4-R1 TaxID=2735134 RepID=UPI001493C223|nr:tRNA glutamyl-Q(34) synthetase GluQRS [Sphingomonas sp. AP4-R1]QJU56892.1 tRNA glutamyl-Q(34) synthetase GluQRS [Sphingomonas sp. AP4-R1]